VAETGGQSEPTSRKELPADRLPVRLLGIGVSNLVEENLQADLFAPSKARLEGLDKAVDAIRDRYGFESIRTGGRGFGLMDTHTRNKE